MSQLSWPKRFAVTVSPVVGESETFEVCTWLHQWKALALAAESYRCHHPDQHVYDVHVEPLGRASRNDDGTASPGKGLHDRYEW